jgi:hypothetical protein
MVAAEKSVITAEPEISPHVVSRVFYTADE